MIVPEFEIGNNAVFDGDEIIFVGDIRVIRLFFEILEKF